MNVRPRTNRILRPNTVIAACVAFAALIALPVTVLAHPLGNFTINHYNGLDVGPGWVTLDHVIDMAELPTVEAQTAMDTNRDGTATDDEAAAYAKKSCLDVTSDLVLKVGGAPAVLAAVAVHISFAPGQAGLETTRLVCEFTATTASLETPGSIDFEDNSFALRQGWREIVIVANGVSLAGVDQYASGTSDRLRSYPVGAGGAIRAQSTAQFQLATVDAQATDQPGQAVEGVPFDSGSSDIVAHQQTPGVTLNGVTDLPAELTNLIQAGDLSIGALGVAIVLALFVGALHAATPGHGKTLMAAYLVGSRGNVRHALGLGLTVTFSHTIGVLVLGLVILAANSALPSDKLLPLLTIVSGVMVSALGIYTLVDRVRASRRRAELEHEHPHEHGHDTSHEHEHEAEATPAGWHSHAGIQHTHLPSSDPLRRRSLVILGLVGGLVPSASAILLLVGAIAAGRPALGIVLTIAFGVGMATVLVGVGVLLVRARTVVERLPSASVGRVLTYAPLITAVVFVIIGISLSIQGGSQLR